VALAFFYPGILLEEGLLKNASFLDFAFHSSSSTTSFPLGGNLPNDLTSPSSFLLIIPSDVANASASPKASADLMKISPSSRALISTHS
jgi:hypothetical protein